MGTAGEAAQFRTEVSGVSWMEGVQTWGVGERAGLCREPLPWSWGQAAAMTGVGAHDDFWPGRGRVGSVLEEAECSSFQ